MSEYNKMVATAEEAVSKLGDEKLKLVAFTEIIKHLLNSQEAPPNEAAPAHLRRASAKSSATTRATANDGGKKKGLPGWLLEMKEEGFFLKPQSAKSIHDELVRNNHHIPPTSLPAALGSLVKSKQLRRNKSTPEDGKRPKWQWSNWG